MRSGRGVTPGTPGVLRRDQAPAQHAGRSGTHSSTSDFLVDVATHGPRGTHTTPSSQVPHRTQSQSGAGKVLSAGALPSQVQRSSPRPPQRTAHREGAGGWAPGLVCVQRPHVIQQRGARRGRGHGRTHTSPVGLQVHSVTALERPCPPGEPSLGDAGRRGGTQGGGVGRRVAGWDAGPRGGTQGACSSSDLSRASNTALM